MFGKKKTKNLKSSYRRYFIEKNHEIFKFKYGFTIVLCKKKQHFLISCKKRYSETLKYRYRFI